MKKLVGLFLVVVLSLTSINFAFANEVDTTSKTLGDVAAELNNFVETKYDFKVGSEEYINFLVDVLMFDEDKDLASMEDYEDICFYASEFLIELQRGENIVLSNDAGIEIAELTDTLMQRKLDEVKQEVKQQENADKETEPSQVENHLLSQLALLVCL